MVRAEFAKNGLLIMTRGARKKLSYVFNIQVMSFLLGSTVAQTSNLTYYDVEIIKYCLKFLGEFLDNSLSETFFDTMATLDKT